MTAKTSPRRRDPSLSVRITKAQAELNATAARWEELPYSEWLRTMAARRRAIVSLYREASRQYDTDTIEWHALMDAALMFDAHAVANDTAAAEHDTTRADAS